MVERTIHFVSLGCAKNRVDTEVMFGVGDEEGLIPVSDPSKAQVIVVNTCGFIGAAKEESINTVLEMAEQKRTGVCKTLVVAGCLSQRYAQDLESALPEVDHFLGSSDMLKLRPILGGATRKMWVGNPAHFLYDANSPRRLSTRPHSANIKIAEGCTRSCSFCAIPSIRGKQRSRPIADIVQEVSTLAEAGLLEANLVSQDTIAYGRDRDGSENLSHLLEALAQIDDLQWIRVHYLYPEKLTDDLVHLFKEHPKVLPYIDMPLQHVADPMLRAMRRGHGGDRIYRTVERLRSALPHMVFRTTLIVGHPGETDDDFEALIKFVQWAQFDHLGVFQYSHEEGTHSGTMTDLVPADVCNTRQRELMALQATISHGKLQRRVGEQLDVLVDGPSTESEFLLDGRWWGQAPEVDGKVVLANAPPDHRGFVRATVTHATDHDLIADGPWDGLRPTPQHRITLPTTS